jgi:hypothetical protein
MTVSRVVFRIIIVILGKYSMDNTDLMVRRQATLLASGFQVSSAVVVSPPVDDAATAITTARAGRLVQV